jgi:outer membrane protein OmpA-like peptidoglycan-associated protein
MSWARIAVIAGMACGIAFNSALAQESLGPLLPHVGGQVDYAFSNPFGPDAEARVTFTNVSPSELNLRYTSTRGLNVTRKLIAEDRQSSKSYVLGYAQNMPNVIPNTTSLGISSASLVELRETGRAKLALVHDAKQSVINGELTLVRKGLKVRLLVEDQIIEVPALLARGSFKGGNKSGSGEFYFLDNKNNPMMLQSTLQFSWEKVPRSEKIVRVAAGASMKSAMEQSLSTLRRYDVYGLRFDFDKATLRSESASLIKDIAQTMRNNPTWTLQINGHTDSIGDAAYNLKLSGARAATVAAELVKLGVAASRLKTAGLGASQPKEDNATLQGRAINRRVELLRTDR